MGTGIHTEHAAVTERSDPVSPARIDRTKLVSIKRCDIIIYVAKNIHAFSPIVTQEQFNIGLERVVTNTLLLVKKVFGVRKPDPTRPWVGYGECPFSDVDYDALCGAANPFVHEITSGIGQSLLQFEHPDFDVLGYAVRMRDHE